MINYPYSRQRVVRARLFSKLASAAFIGVIFLTILGIGLFFWFSRELPQPGRIVRTEGFATKIYDRNEKLLYDVFVNQRRIPVSFDEIPLYLKEATVSIEDKDFYTHSGFDPRGVLRAMRNIVVYHRLQGGSTLTQQLVKNVLLSSERTITRKIKEFILSIQVERRYTKDQILSMYLNEAPYGGTAWGVEAASEIYFGEKVSNLNLVESAILAGLPQQPSTYSPYGQNPDAYKGRTREVLRRMHEDGYITSDQETLALKELEKFQFTHTQTGIKAPHFVMYVKKMLEDKYGSRMVEQGGLKVITSLDLDLQEKAQQIVSEEISKAERLHITNGASIVMDPKTGEILAMVGSKNYDDPNYDGKVNVTLSLRQPGSTIKPVTYVTAFKKGYTPATLVMDTPTTFPGGVGQPDYKPLNYDGKFHGPMQLRYTLGNSVNIPAVKLLALVGIRDMLQTAYDMGFTTLEPTDKNLSRFGLSVTLGGGEVRLIDMVSAYSAFANGGLKVGPVAVLKVYQSNGKLLDEYKPITGKRVLSTEQAFLISNILSDNSARTITFGEHSSLGIADLPVAVKTGTTNDKRDNWTIGWTPNNIITAVWVGNNDNSQMKEVASGVSGAAPIWRRILLTASENKSKDAFIVPDGIVTAEIDNVSGYRSHDSFPSRTEYFVRGTEPSSEDSVHSRLKLCKSSGKLATLVDIARGDYDEKEFFVFKEADPAWQKGIDEWLATQSDSRYHPPTETCETQNQIEVRFKEPQDHSQMGSSFKLSVDPVTSNDIAWVEIYLNGDKKATLSNSPYEWTASDLSNGTYTVKVKAQDTKNNSGEKEIKIGVNVPWDWLPPTPTPTPSPTPTLTPTPTI